MYHSAAGASSCLPLFFVCAGQDVGIVGSFHGIGPQRPVFSGLPICRSDCLTVGLTSVKTFVSVHTASSCLGACGLKCRGVVTEFMSSNCGHHQWPKGLSDFGLYFMPLHHGGCIAMGTTKVLFLDCWAFCCRNFCGLVTGHVSHMQLKAAGQCPVPWNRSLTDACMPQKEPCRFRLEPFHPIYVFTNSFRGHTDRLAP
jgi:hypothetical protein